MTNGADKMLEEVIDNAIDATGHVPADATTVVCKAHEPLRMGVHALLLCKQAELIHPRDSGRVLKFGKLEVSARGADLTKILLAVVIIILLAGDKLPKLTGHVPLAKVPSAHTASE